MAGIFSHLTLIFYIHFLLLASGLCGASILMGVYLKEYSDASQSEIGLLLMSIPFLSIAIKPYFSALADKKAAHKSYFLGGLWIIVFAYIPFIILPFFPAFYKAHPRFCWWMLAFFSEIGSGAIGFVWSLGDALSMNAAMRSGGSFGRIRLMGTISWGIYGYVIGQINETPLLPKFVPVFIILSSSTLVEIILVWLWDDDVFVIKSAPELESGGSKTATLERNPLSGLKSPGMGSLAGSLRLDRRTGQALRDLVATDDLNSRLKHLAESARSPGNTLRHRGQVLDLSAIGDDLEATSTVQQDEQNRNIQAILLTMIFKNDGRLIKYLLLFTMFGIAVSPFQFLFLTLEEISKERAVNFSNLAGTVIVSQAAIEAVAFFIMPWLNRCASRTSILTTGLLVLAARCFFYGYFYYTQDISLYWAVLAEWGHGIPFAMFCTLQADIAVMFAGQSAIFVPQLIKLGILSDPELVGRLKAKEEEESIKTMLRATMNAIFSGANEGFGQGLGCLICGLVYDHFGYVNLWRVVFFVTAATMIAHLATEATRSQYSDYCSKYRKTSIKAELTNQCSGENIEQNVISHHLKKPDEEEKPRS